MGGEAGGVGTGGGGGTVGIRKREVNGESAAGMKQKALIIVFLVALLTEWR